MPHFVTLVRYTQQGHDEDQGKPVATRCCQEGSGEGRREDSLMVLDDGAL